MLDRTRVRNEDRDWQRVQSRYLMAILADCLTERRGEHGERAQ
jgi:hypothetical protein